MVLNELFVEFIYPVLSSTSHMKLQRSENSWCVL